MANGNAPWQPLQLEEESRGGRGGSEATALCTIAPTLLREEFCQEKGLLSIGMQMRDKEDANLLYGLCSCSWRNHTAVTACLQLGKDVFSDLLSTV